MQFDPNRPILSGETVDFDPGVVVIDGPIVVADRDSVTLRGSGGTVLLYQGPPTEGVVQLARTNRSRVLDFDVIVDAAGVDAGILVTNLPGTSPEGRVSSAATVSNVRVMHGGYPTAARRAFSVDSFAMGGADGNNDHHTFTDCLAQSYTEAGFFVSGTQCHHMTFSRCFAINGRSHVPGPRPDGWRFGDGVYFTSRDCGGNRNQTDFRFGNREMSVRVENFNSEHSRQFVVTSRTGGAFTFKVDGVRWDGEPEPGLAVVDLWGTGPWSIDSAVFAGVNGLTPTVMANHYNHGNGVRLPGSLTLKSVTIRQHLGQYPDMGQLIQAPLSWEISEFALWWERIRDDGGRDRNKIGVCLF